MSIGVRMPHLDLSFIRQQFPAFNEASLANTVFLENAGGSYMCKQVLERLNTYYRQCKIQPYYPNQVSEQAGHMMDEAYTSLAQWMNVLPENIYFGPSTSQNTYTLAQSMLGWLQAGDEIIVTNQDHEANSGVWRRLAQNGIQVKEWLVDSASGTLTVDDLMPLMTDKTKLLVFPHCSNILGHINPVADICNLARQYGVRTVVDGVSFAGHGLPDVAALKADIYLFSLYKVYGPHQGVMVINTDITQFLANQSHYFNDSVREKRLMPSGPDHAQIAAVKGVADYFEAVSQHHFGSELAKEVDSQEKRATALRHLLHASEQKLLTHLLDYVKSNAKLSLIGPNQVEMRAPTVSVTTESMAPSTFAKQLGEKNILCGAGHFYSARLFEALGIDSNKGVLRFSLVHYNSLEDIDTLASELDRIL